MKKRQLLWEQNVSAWHLAIPVFFLLGIWTACSILFVNLFEGTKNTPSANITNSVAFICACMGNMYFSSKIYRRWTGRTTLTVDFRSENKARNRKKHLPVGTILQALNEQGAPSVSLQLEEDTQALFVAKKRLLPAGWVDGGKPVGTPVGTMRLGIPCSVPKGTRILKIETAHGVIYCTNNGSTLLLK